MSPKKIWCLPVILIVALFITTSLVVNRGFNSTVIAAPERWTQVIYPQGAGFEFSGLPNSGGWVEIHTQNTVYCSKAPNKVVYTQTRTPPNTNDVDWARWRPTLPSTARYDVYVYIPDYTHVTNVTGQARYKINHANGQTTVTVNQNNNKCSWFYLGRYQFNAGTSGNVYLGDYTGDNPHRLIAADAVKFARFEPTPTSTNTPQSPTQTPTATPTHTPPAPSNITIDDGGNGFTTSSNYWQVVTSNWTRGCTGRQGDARWTYSRQPGNANDVDWARWRPNLPQSGSYEVYFYVPGVDNGTMDTQHARYRVHHADGNTVVKRSQHGNWCRWVSLGTFYFNAGSSGWVYLGDYTGENVSRSIVADGMRWVYRGSQHPPTPTPQPTTPPPTDIVSAARADIDMPYSVDRQPYCGSYGPWDSRLGVCTDLVIDAYLSGTGGDGPSNLSCGVSWWSAMGQNVGGVNLEALLRADDRQNPGHYPNHSARNAIDMRIYFIRNQTYLTKNQPWQVGDIAFFDWNHNGTADHVAIISRINSNNKPTKMVHAPGGGTSCDSHNDRACETNFGDRMQYVMGHGRLSNINMTSLTNTENTTSVFEGNYLVVTVNQPDTDLLVTLRDASGDYVTNTRDEDLLVSNNEDFIPYIAYTDYEQANGVQTIYYYAPPNGEYQIEVAGVQPVNYTIQIETYHGASLISALQYNKSTLVNGSQTIDLTLTNDSGDLVAYASPPVTTAQLDAPPMLAGKGFTSQEVTLSWVISETSGLAGAGTLTTAAQQFVTREGDILDFTVTSANTPILNAGEEVEITIVMSIAQDAVPGNYDGAFVIQASGGNTITLPVQLSISSNKIHQIFLPAVMLGFPDGFNLQD